MIRRFCLVLPCLLVALWLPALAAEEPVPDTVIVSQSCEITSTDTQTLSVFTGNVIVTGNNIRLTCDRLDVVSLRSGAKQDTLGKQERFKSLVATGGVRIVQGDREATCEHAEVLPGEDRITLTGHPVVTDHGNNSTATGEPLVLYRGERRITGRNVRIVLPPLRDLGFDKHLPPPVPTEEPRKLP
jgi:lipopolysaccharide export system protein LptA